MRTAAGIAGSDATVNCAAGDIATGGGGHVTTVGGTNQELRRSAPITGGVLSTANQTPNGWLAHSNQTFTVYVVCLDITP